MRSNFVDENLDAIIAVWEPLRLPIKDALDFVTQRESILLAKQLFEPTLSHRLAVQLEGRFDDCDVDCEYSRTLTKNGHPMKSFRKEDLIKNLTVIHDGFNANKFELFAGARFSLDRYFKNAERLIRKTKKQVERWVRPDIIVHHRGTNQNNLLALELKLLSTPKSLVPIDLAKLMEFTVSPEFRYRCGLFLELAPQTPHLRAAILFVNGASFELNCRDNQLDVLRQLS